MDKFNNDTPGMKSEEIIVDCNYSFDEAIAGTKAPVNVIAQLELIDVLYYSVDNKIHKGQLLTNRLMVPSIRKMFRYMLSIHFPVDKVIPVVYYDWDDEKSMESNNTYSFCYRDVSYSKHALGMAIDINPFFNPLRWKNGYTNRLNVPVGAKYDNKRPGTFYPDHPVVKYFQSCGYRWGHTFTRCFDDHHFEL